MNRLEVQLARAVSRTAHAGQVDKAGAPYIHHPARIALKVSQELPKNANAIAAAYLHDVVEDSPVTIEDLLLMGFSYETVKIVDHLTRREGESHEAAVRRAAEHPIARIVKRYDVLDNSNPSRLAKLDPKTRERLEKKYVHALEILGLD